MLQKAPVSLQPSQYWMLSLLFYFVESLANFSWELHATKRGKQPVISLQAIWLSSSEKYQWKRVSLKPNSSANFMINLSIQNFIPFLVPHLFPSSLRSIKKGGGGGAVETEQGPAGPPGYKTFLYPYT